MNYEDERCVVTGLHPASCQEHSECPLVSDLIGGSGPDYISREEHRDALYETEGMLMGVIRDVSNTLLWTRLLLALTVFALFLVLLVRT